MFFMPVDLFTPFIQGREYAIDRNWNDLNQANKVEQGWLNNDAQRWRNMFTEDTYQDKLQQYQNQTAASNMERQIAETGHLGNLAQADFMARYMERLAAAGGPLIDDMVRGQTTGWLGNAAQQEAEGNARLQHSRDLFGGLAEYNVDKLRNDRNLLDLEHAAKQAALAGQINNALTPAGGTTSGTGPTLAVPDKFKQPSKQSTPTPQVQQPTQQTVSQPAAVQQTSQGGFKLLQPPGLPYRHAW